jgi:hypothetical protein
LYVCDAADLCHTRLLIALEIANGTALTFCYFQTAALRDTTPDWQRRSTE